MNKPANYDDIESWLKAYKPWKSRIRAIEEQIPFLNRFMEERERLRHDPDIEPELLQRYDEIIRILKRQQAELPVYQLRIMVLETCFASLSEENIRFAELKYVEGMLNEEVQDRLSLSPSTFFRRRKEILADISSMTGDAERFLRTVLPDEERPILPLFLMDGWFYRRKPAARDPKAIRPLLQNNKRTKNMSTRA